MNTKFEEVFVAMIKQAYLAGLNYTRMSELVSKAITDINPDATEEINRRMAAIEVAIRAIGAVVEGPHSEDLDPELESYLAGALTKLLEASGHKTADEVSFTGLISTSERNGMFFCHVENIDVAAFKTRDEAQAWQQNLLKAMIRKTVNYGTAENYIRESLVHDSQDTATRALSMLADAHKEKHSLEDRLATLEKKFLELEKKL